APAVWLGAYRPPLTPAIWAVVALTILTAFQVMNSVAAIGLIAVGVDLAGATIPFGSPLWVLVFPFSMMGTVTVFLVPAVVPGLLSWWSHRSRANMTNTLSAPLGWSPGWAACGWFLPIANLFVPYLVLRQLWSASGLVRDRWILAVWWAAWLAEVLYFWLIISLNAVIVIHNPLVNAATDVINMGLALASGITGIVMVLRLTALMEARHRQFAPTGAPDNRRAEPPPRWAAGYTSVAVSSWFATVAAVVAAMSSLVMAAMDAVALFVVGKPLALTEGPVNAVWFLALCLFVLICLPVGAAAIAVWTYGAYRNLPALGAGGLSWSPGWGAGAWFVPIANLFVPYLVTRQVWLGTAAGQRSLLLLAWTALLTAGALFGLSIDFGGLGPFFSESLWMLAELAFAFGAVLFASLIRRVTVRQAARDRALRAPA
ncbi:MAG: DUF4328 domain-containing protein, partial [Actinobacteria bacterium]|nr:DUF4328 domain-containing protein [Actinomycetota bacterium]